MLGIRKIATPSQPLLGLLRKVPPPHNICISGGEALPDDRITASKPSKLKERKKCPKFITPTLSMFIALSLVLNALLCH